MRESEKKTVKLFNVKNIAKDKVVLNILSYFLVTQFLNDGYLWPVFFRLGNAGGM